MLKLIRKIYGTETNLRDNEDGKIEWRYVENLEKYRMNKNFVTHKLTKQHFEFDKNKMCVKLAAKLFSNAVANSLSYLMSHSCNGFENCAATIKFIQIISNLFDVFNSTGKDTSNIFKKPISNESATEVFAFLEKTTKYLETIRINGKYIIDTRLRTGITSLKSMYETYVKTGLLRSIPTYQLSQDPLESLHARLRSMCGNNDNPTAIQFTPGLRKNLIKNEISSPALAICEDKLKILVVSSKSNFLYLTIIVLNPFLILKALYKIYKSNSSNNFIFSLC